MIDNPSLFDLTLPKRQMKDKIRLIELFAGIGSQAKALKNLNIQFEHWKVCEIDKYAINSYNAIHNTNFTTSDITKLTYKDLDIKNTDEYDYIMTYSFPCQDLSLAGKRKGMEKGKSTRSGLLWQVERLLIECKENNCLPQILLMENVRQVITSKGWHDWVAFLEKLGYQNYCDILNGKDFGIPQTRERAFMISILGEHSYSMPKQLKLILKLKNMLEDNVDDSYYLSDKKINQIINWKAYQKPFEKVCGKNSICPTLTARGAGEEHSGMILVCEDLDETTNLHFKIKEATKKGYAIAQDGDGVYINRPHQKRGVVQKGMIQTIKTSVDDIGVVVKEIKDIIKLRIRKLTPKECYRLMGFDDSDYEKASKINSNAQLYKQAGNSIIVQVLMAIFGELFNIDYISKINESLKKIKGE